MAIAKQDFVIPLLSFDPQISPIEKREMFTVMHKILR